MFILWVPPYILDTVIVEQEKENTKKVNYWGYTSSAYYFAPKSSYASNSKKVVEEVKQMVTSFHEAGIDVYLEMMFDYFFS